MRGASHLLKTHLPLHTWCGVVSALFLIVCFLAGALTLFLDDLNRWAAPPPPSVRPAPDARQQAQLLDYMAAHPEITTTFTLHLRTTADAPAPLSWDAYALRRGAGATGALLCISIALLCAIPATTGLAAAGWLPFAPRLLLPVDATALLLAIALYLLAPKSRLHAP